MAFIRSVAPVSVRSTIAALATVLVDASGVAAARGEDAPRDVGGWTVTASSDGNGCFLTKGYDRPGGTTLLLGLDVDGTNRLTVLNDHWSIKPKDRLKLDYRLSNASFPGHFAIGIASDAKQGFVTSFGAKFPTIFAAARTLQIFRGDVPVERLSLDGSGAAVAGLRACVARQRGGRVDAAGGKRPVDSIPKDPFAPESGRKQKR